MNAALDQITINLPDLPLKYAPSDNPFISNEEIRFLLSSALKKKGNMLEIGINRGKTTNNLARIAKGENCKFIAVDVTEPPKTICDAQNVGECLPENVVGCDITPEHKPYVSIRLINPNSPNALGELLKELNMQFDFVFIDGDHSYEGVLKDYQAVMPWISPQGVVLFHDVWWDVDPAPVKGPLKLLQQTGGYIVNGTHLGILKEHAERF